MKNPLKLGYLEDGLGGVDQLVAGCGWNLQSPQIFKLKFKKIINPHSCLLVCPSANPDCLSLCQSFLPYTCPLICPSASLSLR
jgi:hypothetical protein